MWYRIAKNLATPTHRRRNESYGNRGDSSRGVEMRTALRKNTLRVDLHVRIGDETTLHTHNDLDSSIMSVLMAAIEKGLDVVGVISVNGPQIGQHAWKLAKAQGVDLYVIPGQEYVTADRYSLLLYNLTGPVKAGMTAAQVIAFVRRKGGQVIASTVTRRQAQELSRWVGTDNAPTGIEILNASSGGYRDMETTSEYPAFVTSAAANASDMAAAKTFYTLVKRSDFTAMGFLPKNEGVDYTPPYLTRSDEVGRGANEAAVAAGEYDAPDKQAASQGIAHATSGPPLPVSTASALSGRRTPVARRFGDCGWHLRYESASGPLHLECGERCGERAAH